MGLPIHEEKRVLAFSGDLRFLEILEQKIFRSYPQCRFDTAETFARAVWCLASSVYDLVMYDLSRKNGIQLLKRACLHDSPMVLFTDGRRSEKNWHICMGSRILTAFSKRDVLQVTAVIEQMLRPEGLSRWVLVNKLADFPIRVFQEPYQQGAFHGDCGATEGPLGITGLPSGFHADSRSFQPPVSTRWQKRL